MVDLRTDLSIVLPAFNEAGNLADCYTVLKSVLDKCGIVSYEFIIVDDGSEDETYDVASRLKAYDQRVQIVRHDKNRGYGAAVRSGMAAARGEVIFWTDSDGQIDPDQLPRGIALLKEYSAVLGYRVCRRDGPVRDFMSWMGKTLNRFFLGLDAKDVGCAFRIFRKDHLPSNALRSKGIFINTEWLLFFKDQGLAIAEIPVRHHAREKGRATGASFRVQLSLWKEWLARRRCT